MADFILDENYFSNAQENQRKGTIMHIRKEVLSLRMIVLLQ